jgi:hypothetical protein
VRDGRGARHDLGAVVHPGVPLGIRPLADDRDVGVGLRERTDESVDVTPDATAIRGNGRRVDEDART